MFNNERTPQRFTRRTAVALSFSALLQACAPSAPQPKNAPSSQNEERAKTILTQTAKPAEKPLDLGAWGKLPVAQRRRQLEFRQLPAIEGFEPYKEMAAVVAELYCQDGIFTKNPQELQDSIRIVNGAELLEQARKQAIRPLTEADVVRFRDQAFEIVDEKDGTIYLNQQLIEDASKRDLARNPNLTTQLQGRDLSMMMTEVVLFHAYSHASHTNEAFDFTPLVVEDGTTNNVNFTLTRFEGFGLSGYRPDGSPLRYGNEGLAELVAKIKTGPGSYPTFRPEYADAVTLANALNRRAGITPREMLEYFMGKKGPDSAKLFLTRWGSIKNRQTPDQYAGLQALMAVELRSHGNISQQEAINAIRGYLGPDALPPLR